jgi:hypothetical protein
MVFANTSYGLRVSKILYSEIVNNAYFIVMYYRLSKPMTGRRNINNRKQIIEKYVSFTLHFPLVIA